MKNLLLLLILLCSSSAYSQNKIYTITEQFSGMGLTNLDRIIVTDPTGNTSTYDITHFLKDPVAHDSEFIKILNEVTARGYELIDTNPNAHGDMISGKSVFTKTWFLKQKN